MEDDELFDEELLEDYREEEGGGRVEVTLSLLNTDESSSLQDTPPPLPPPVKNGPTAVAAAGNGRKTGESPRLSRQAKGDESSDYNFFRPARNSALEPKKVYASSLMYTVYSTVIIVFLSNPLVFFCIKYMSETNLGINISR